MMARSRWLPSSLGRTAIGMEFVRARSVVDPRGVVHMDREALLASKRVTDAIHDAVCGGPSAVDRLFDRIGHAGWRNPSPHSGKFAANIVMVQNKHYYCGTYNDDFEERAHDYLSESGDLSRTKEGYVLDLTIELCAVIDMNETPGCDYSAINPAALGRPPRPYFARQKMIRPIQMAGRPTEEDNCPTRHHKARRGARSRGKSRIGWSHFPRSRCCRLCRYGWSRRRSHAGSSSDANRPPISSNWPPGHRCTRGRPA